MVARMEDAVDLVSTLMQLTGPETDGGSAELLQAIVEHDTQTLFRLLTRGLGYQGISDAVARRYAEQHGDADWQTIETMLGRDARCQKLAGFEDFGDCRFTKTGPSCSNPSLLSSCPVSQLPLRRGLLNEQAFSLFLLIADRCEGDLVAHIDRTLSIAWEEPDPVTVGREALIALLTSVRGVSRKVASMMLATLLVSADLSRPRWRAVGRSMVAIDSLVHNFLHRTGILHAYKAEHRYSALCYGPTGCEAVVRDLASRLPSDACASPRSLQHAIWHFCAADGLAICNGRRIRDTAACQQLDCPLAAGCARMPLRPGNGEGQS
jgi:hypothetical protein